MKYLIAGDIHGIELKYLEKALKIEKPDTLIFTGDFDFIKTIRDFIKLEEKLKFEGKEVIKVPGNHDFHILYNLPLNSGCLQMQGKTCDELHQELLEDKIAYNYLEKLVAQNHEIKFNLNSQKYNSDFNSVAVHGGFDGDLDSFSNCPDKIKKLWYRLLSINDYKINFDLMNKSGLNIMIRGHDHHPVYVFNDNNLGIAINNNISIRDKFQLLENRQHIINSGAMFEGYFATIDTKKEIPILQFKEL